MDFVHGRWAAGGVALAACGAGLSMADTANPQRTADRYTRQVAIVLYDNVEVLDFAGPAEVLQAAAGFGSSREKPAFRLFTVAPARTPLKSQRFLTLTPDHTPADAPPPDIIVVPGGSTQHLLEDVAFMEWFRSAAEKAELVLTVCTGAFVPAKLGLLDGKTATTWYGAVENLREAAPKVTVQPGRRFVDNGRIVTTAGVSAGIDGALHVVARLLGRNVAERTAQYMEYHWSPEAYLARTYTLLNPSVDERGRRFQQASIAEDEGNVEQALAAFRELAQSDPADAYAWYRVGASLQRLGRLDEAIAAAERATTAPEVRAPALYNLACARALKGDKEGALRSIREAVDAGFDDFHALRTDPDLASIRSDSRFPRL